MLLVARLALAGPYEDAQAALAADQCDRAVLLFDQALHRDPGDQRADIGRSTCLARLRRDDEAISELHSVVTPGLRLLIEGDPHQFVSLVDPDRSLAEREFAETTRLLVDHGLPTDADALLGDAARIVPASGARIIARAWVTHALQGDDAAWAEVAAAFVDHPDDPLLVPEAARMAFRVGRSVPDAVVGPILSRGDAEAYHNLLAGVYNGHAYARCLTVVGQARGREPEVALFGYRCALLAPDDAAVATWRDQLGATLPVAEAVLDADQRRRKNDLSTAAAVLDRTHPTTDAERAKVAGARALLAVQLGQWDAALGYARTTGVDPQVVSAVADALARVGRTADAASLRP